MANFAQGLGGERIGTFRETVPPRWRFESVRRALQLLPQRYAGIRVAAEDDLKALEEALLPPVPTITEFQAKMKEARDA